MRIVLSRDPVSAISPSAETLMLMIAAECARKFRSSDFFARLHTRTVWSNPADAARSAPANATAETLVRCPARIADASIDGALSGGGGAGAFAFPPKRSFGFAGPAS